MNRLTFQSNMARLAAAFSVEVTPEKAAVYWDDLCDLSDQQFTVACTRARREWDKPFALPPIALFLRFASEAAQEEGDIVDGQSAWTYLQTRTVRKFRPGVAVREPGDPDPFRSKQDPLDWPDELARSIVRDELGGIYALAVTEGDYAREQQRKRFVASYDRRRQTVQAVERAEAQLDAPGNVRRLQQGAD